LAVALVVLSFAACEQEVTDSPPPRTVVDVDAEEPCSLLTPDQVEQAIGTEVGGEAEVDSHDPVTRICSYDTTEPWASVGVSLVEDVTLGQFTEKMNRDSINTEPVGGIGNGAFIHGCASITTLVGDVMVSVSIQHLTTCEETNDVLKALGGAVEEALKA